MGACANKKAWLHQPREAQLLDDAAAEATGGERLHNSSGSTNHQSNSLFPCLPSAAVYDRPQEATLRLWAQSRLCPAFTAASPSLRQLHSPPSSTSPSPNSPPAPQRPLRRPGRVSESHTTTDQRPVLQAIDALPPGQKPRVVHVPRPLL